MNQNFDNQRAVSDRDGNVDYSAGNTVPAFSGAFDDDSVRPTMGTDGQTVQPFVPSMYGQPVGQYAPPMYGQPVGQYAPPMYGQPVGQYAPPMYGQPVGQYAPPMYGQPVGQYAPPMYGQPMYVQPVQYPVLPKEVVDKNLFRKHCSRIGWMLMADYGLMFGVQLVVIIVAVIVIAIIGAGGSVNLRDPEQLTAYLLAPVMFAGGLSAIVGNMIPSSLHLRKWKYKFTAPFKGDKLNPFFTLAALFTALGLNTAWCNTYYYLKDWFGAFMGYVPENTEKLYTPESMPLVGMICYLVWVCIIAPVTEEYIFRGAMLRTLSHYGSGFAIVASAFAFGLMHGNMLQTPMAFLIGLVMGYVAAKSGNIRQSILIHLINNIIASIPQILSYFLPDWLDPYAEYVTYFDYATMIFAGVALLYFIITRETGLSARKRRASSGGEHVSGAERSWLRLEIPDERRLPKLDSVRHKFCHFVTSGGMIFFIVVCLLSVFFVSFLPYILKQPIPGVGI